MKYILISLILMSIMLKSAFAISHNVPDQSLSIVPVALNDHVVKIAENHNLSSDRGTGFGTYSDTAKKTWVTWAGENMSAYIREYDHANHSWSESKIIGQIPDTTFFQYDWSQQKTDHHNYPKMTQMNDGKLIVIYSAHNSRLYKSISPSANTVKGWDASHYEEIKNGKEPIKATYPLVNKSSNGNIYIFYRYTTGNLCHTNNELKRLLCTFAAAQFRYY